MNKRNYTKYYYIGAGLLLFFVLFLFVFSDTLTKHADHFFYVQKQKLSNLYQNNKVFEYSIAVHIDYKKLSNLKDNEFNETILNLIEKIEETNPKAIINITYPQVYNNPSKLNYAYNELRKKSRKYRPLVFDLSSEYSFESDLNHKVSLALRDLSIENDYLLNFHYDTIVEPTYENLIVTIHKLLAKPLKETKTHEFKSHKIIYSHSNTTTPYITAKDIALKKEEFKNKIVVIGTANKLTKLQRRLSLSHYNTPIGTEGLALSSPQVIQQIIENIGSKTIKKIPSSLLYLPFFLFLFFTIFFTRKTSTSLFVAIFISANFILYGANVLLFSHTFLHLSFVYILIPSFFYFVISLFFRISNETKQRLKHLARNEVQNEINKIQNVFLEDLTHSLKNKNHFIRNRFKQSDKSDNEDQERMVELALLSCDDFDEYLSGIEQFAKVNNLEIDKKNWQKINLIKLINSTVNLFDVSVKAKKINCIIDVKSSIQIKTDPILLKLIIQNLVSNAVKYTKKSSIIVISAKKHRRKVHIEVSDQGPGIPEQEKENIWERFYRIKNDDVYEVKGTGLGLYLSQYFAHKLKIKLQLKESDKTGSTFQVII